MIAPNLRWTFLYLQCEHRIKDKLIQFIPRSHSNFLRLGTYCVNHGGLSINLFPTWEWSGSGLCVYETPFPNLMSCGWVLIVVTTGPSEHGLAKP